MVNQAFLEGQDVKEAMLKAGVESVAHHDCGLCGYETAYVVREGELWFDRGCRCTMQGENLEPRTWQDAADWINMQSNPEVRKRLMSDFGFVILEPANKMVDDVPASE